MTTRRLLTMALFFIYAILLFSCDDWYEESIEGNGEVIVKERSITSFDELICKGNFDVYITKADSISLIVEAEDNLVPFIITKVSGNKLYVEEKDGYSLDSNEPIEIYVTTPNLEGAILAGSGSIECDSVANDFLELELTGSGRISFDYIDVIDLDIKISGSGDITIAGIADRGDFKITGSGSIRSIDLFQHECEAKITGSGNMYINVDDYLKAIITGSGDIYYLGNPDIDEHITGSGNVHRY